MKLSELASLPTKVTIVFEDEAYVVAGGVMAGIGAVDIGGDLVRGLVANEHIVRAQHTGAYARQVGCGWTRCITYPRATAGKNPGTVGKESSGLAHQKEQHW